MMFTNSVLKTFYRLETSRKLLSTLVRSSVEVRCCGSLYKEWNDLNLKPYLPKPPKPELRMPLEYLRTPNSKSKFTVLVFHGTPGNAEQFRVLGDMLNQERGVDFIVPAFPDINYTLRMGEYFHSAEERVEIVGSLLQQLDVKQIDMVICHSAGSYPALLMTCNQNKIRVKSLVLLCSTTSRLIPSYRPPWLHASIVSLIDIPVLKKLIVPCYKLITSAFGLNKMTSEEGATSLMSVYATRYWYPEKAPEWIKRLASQDIPRMAMYSSRDFVVPTKLSEQFVEELGNPDRANHFVYDGKSDDQLERLHEPLNRNLPPVVNFTKGGHNIMQQFPRTVLDHLLKFYDEAVLKQN